MILAMNMRLFKKVSKRCNFTFLRYKNTNSSRVSFYFLIWVRVFLKCSIFVNESADKLIRSYFFDHGNSPYLNSPRQPDILRQVSHQ